jgi:FAD/FMN-containing dehydrogenase
LWADVIPETAEFGLAGLVGSSSHVGVVGYTMGGGFGWLGRKYGFASDSVTRADVVTAAGELRRVSAHENADLFWGLKGGGGNFGIVASLEFSLYPITEVYGGNLFYPVERAREVLELYAGWNETLPDEMTSAITFMNIPPIPEIPEPLRGGRFISVRGCYCGEKPEKGEELLRAWREFGAPVVDTFGVMPAAAMDAISMDPVDPLGAYGHSEILRDLSPETIDTLVEVAGAESNSPLILLEIRRLGGALSRPPSDLSPMGHSDAPFIINGIGATPTPEVASAVQSYLAYLAEAVKPHQTGATYVNFMDLDGASEDRVRAAYSPEDWKRLVALKDKYDPSNLFRFNRNISPTG